MSVEFRDVVDVEDQYVREIPFGRNLLLRAAGIALFGAAIAAAVPKAVRAQPFPCFGRPECSCCSGDVCCASGCSPLVGICPSGLQCWQTCAFGDVWQCCDWQGDPVQGQCICTRIVGNC